MVAPFHIPTNSTQELPFLTFASVRGFLIFLVVAFLRGMKEDAHIFKALERIAKLFSGKVTLCFPAVDRAAAPAILGDASLLRF